MTRLKYVIMSLAVWGVVTSAQASATTQEQADAYFAEENWAESVKAYKDLLETDAKNAANLFQLAASLHNLENYKAAEKNYLKALKAEHPRPVVIHLRLARVHMSQGHKDKAFAALETVGDMGGPNFRVVENMAEFTSIKDTPRFKAVLTDLTPCAAGHFRDFDFWLGEWDVTSAGNTAPSATNSITTAHDGCVLREDYVAGYFTGMSLSFYDRRQEKWHQTWMSNAGGALYIEGGLNEDGAMVLSNADLPISKVNESISRVTWTPNKDGTVRQHWENSTDFGETWSTVFDGTYARKATQTP